MFGTVLVANRGEIACRVLRTVRRLGLRGVAVYSEADAAAPHVALADDAFGIGPAPAAESYLRIDAIIGAARRAGAEAIHPGYGFLSENAAFAEACAAAGIVFIGPPPAAIRAMGSKSAAKALMAEAGVPVVPGYHGTDQSPGRLRAEAARIGFPLLVKASAGGGGKGMRIAASAPELDAALALAQGEAMAAFGDDRVLLERYLQRARHIEVQVFGDTHGTVLHLFERDCSVQRRHQKILEEAPAPGLEASRRQAICGAACEAARAVGYVGAGTVEFIADGHDFYFMEMNTRLQVEHPVTEAITGQDLVEWQLRVAAGEPLPLHQADLTLHGHAVEARLYAEDAARDFAPSMGRVAHLRLPAGGEGIRVDTGIAAGDAVGVHYDPMLAKIVAHGPDRPSAVARLARALAATEVAGVTTNLPLLRAIVAHPGFRAGAVDTGFIQREAAVLLAPPAPAPAWVLAAAAAHRLAECRAQPGQDAADPWSPWGQGQGWRLNGDGHQDFRFREADATRTARVHFRPGGLTLDLPGASGALAYEPRPDGTMLLRFGGRAALVRVVRLGERLALFSGGESHGLALADPLAAPATAATASGRILAPMPGTVVSVPVQVGQRVARGDVLLVLEAMKVRLPVAAPEDGVVALLHCRPGDVVEDGAELVSLG